ncbi:Signal recognition particle 9 kDa protein [Rhizoctonia solani]|uniref:Signal recognition particle subunit SRP68 n=1 Tax=Rhizoctonia solani TaxID=456999 RepID=A0A8H7ILR4_9AGAM|nr:Signal recognition particle 9 kDa protein [Rhizoctonia solani]
MSSGPLPHPDSRRGHQWALQVVSDERGAYGLRYNDHARYRKHCANKVHRLRRGLKITHGKGREFKKLPVISPENLKDGQALRTITKSDDAKTRNIAMGRFRRAVKWSGQLSSDLQALREIQPPRVSSTGLAEAVAYHLAIRGRLLRLQDEFQPGLEALVAARTLLDALSKSASSSRDHAVYVQFADEIAPEIRHCAHELGLARAYDIDGIVSTLGSKVASALIKDYENVLKGIQSEGAEKKGGDKAKQLQEIVWEGKPVPVRSPITKFDGVLLALSEAEEVAKKLADAQKTASTQPSEPGARDAHFISSFVTYQLLSRRTQRDLLLAEALLATPVPTPGKQNETPQKIDHRVAPAVVKLLDTILQSLNQMRSLSVVDESADLTMAVEGRLSYTKARRALFLSRTYEPHNKFAEAVALTQRANLHLREAHTNFNDVAEDTPETAFYPLTLDSVKELEKDVQDTETDLKKRWFAYNGGKAVGNQHQKPVFFDIALNYIELPMEKLQEKAGVAPKAQPAKASPVVEKRVFAERKAAEPEAEEPAPAPQQSQGMLGSLLVDGGDASENL